MTGSVRMLKAAEVTVYMEVLQAADVDSGRSGAHFHPYGAREGFDMVAGGKRNARQWCTPLGLAGWRRAWGWFDGERMLGQLTVTGGALLSGLHRVQLGMGVVPEYRGRGGGTRLLTEVIAWGRAQDRIAWMDLGVFADNPRAAALYRRLGFVEIGRTRDRYRVDGVSLDEIAMTLFVGATPLS